MYDNIPELLVLAGDVRRLVVLDTAVDEDETSTLLAKVLVLVTEAASTDEFPCALTAASAKVVARRAHCLRMIMAVMQQLTRVSCSLALVF